jgi:hypothetical protein
MSIFEGSFWKAAFERAVKSFSQGLLVSGVGGVGILDLDWIAAISLAAAYAVASLLTSVGTGLAQDGNISWTRQETLASKVAADKGELGNYESGPAAPYPEGTPVDVVPDDE